ncbi:MAG: CoA-binding protein [Spirochaetes bacterium]|nr:CoA-binding protein [Spirochaetota bacterium]
MDAAVKKAIHEFMAQKHIAIVGVSRSGKKFSNSIYKELKSDGYHVYAVNPNAAEVMGDVCYPSVSALPKEVTGIIIVTDPALTLGIIQEAQKRKIAHVWMQQGAESDEAVDYCAKNGLPAVHGRCIFMYARDRQFPHSLHAGIAKLLNHY